MAAKAFTQIPCKEGMGGGPWKRGGGGEGREGGGGLEEGRGVKGRAGFDSPLMKGYWPG